ncbi:MAG: MBL fold metallo-hydrolase [Candidatus Cyclobacteriaceae bacterium M2_1C_046]
MKITFLGTGTSQGVPVIGCGCRVCKSLDFRDKRFRSSVHIQIDEKSFVIDCGPDFRQQMLANDITTLNALVFTHEHKDHTAGLDDVRAFNFKQQKDMPIYAHPRVLKQLKQEFSYAFTEKKYPGVPSYKLFEIDSKPFKIEGVNFLPIQVFHYQLPVFGFRINDFCYITDANLIPEAEKEKLIDCKILVINALQKEEHISHFNLNEALEVIEELKPQQAYLTHISHKMGRHGEVDSLLPDNVQIAYDGLTVSL